MGHDHTHDHAPSHSKAFAVSLVLNTGFVVVEAVYGLVAGSMALVADAAHNLGDVLGLALAWGATRLARIEPSNRRTYGWRKSTILAALLNALLIMVAVGGVAWEAVQRLGNPTEINGWTVTTVASIGVAINTVADQNVAGRNVVPGIQAILQDTFGTERPVRTEARVGEHTGAAA